MTRETGDGKEICDMDNKPGWTGETAEPTCLSDLGHEGVQNGRQDRDTARGHGCHAQRRANDWAGLDRPVWDFGVTESATAEMAAVLLGRALFMLKFPVFFSSLLSGVRLHITTTTYENTR